MLKSYSGARRTVLSQLRRGRYHPPLVRDAVERSFMSQDAARTRISVSGSVHGTHAASGEIRSSIGSVIKISRVPTNLSRSFSAKSYPEHEVIKLPALSPTMTGGKIIEWNKNVGDKIEPGDSLLIIETDKSCIDFDMQTEGYLAYKVTTTSDLPIGQPIAVIVEDSELVKEFEGFSFDDIGKVAPDTSPSEPEPQSAEHEESAQVGSASPQTAAAVASPSAKRLAKSLGIDISMVKGSGPGGRIVNQDVTSFASKAQQPAKVEKPSPAPASTPQPPPPQPAPGVSYVDIPLSNVRHAIIKSLAKSKAATPEYSLTLSANMDKLLKMREDFNATSFGTYKITVNDMIVKTACAVLKKVPEMNSHFIGNSIRQFKPVNICIAMAADEGLYVPVLKAADEMGLIEISNGVKALAQKTKAGRLSPQDLTDGTFTISNLGMYHIDSFNSILVNPQVGILSVGIVKKVVEPCKNDPEKYIIANCANFTLTADHRAIDGHVAAKWLYEFKKIIEEPQNMLL